MSRKPAVGARARLLACLILAPVGCQREPAPSDGSSGGAGSIHGDDLAAAPSDAGLSDPASDPATDPAADPFGSIESLRPRPWATWPLENIDIESFDGWRIDPGHGGFVLEHGLVFASEPGAFVLAIADAQVIEVSPITEAGEAQPSFELHLDHGRGIESHVGPLVDVLVHAGLPVTRGAAIGLAAGNSLRLRVTIDGIDIDPLMTLRQPLHRWHL